MRLAILGVEEEEKQEESKKNGNRVEISLLDQVSHSLLHANDLSHSTSQVDLPPCSEIVFFVYLSGDKLFTAAYKTLYVYLVSDITSPISTYSLSNECYSGIISDNRLYLGGFDYLKIFELTTSVTQPLTPVAQIKTKDCVNKILRVGH
jgi:hypothetical protein